MSRIALAKDAIYFKEPLLEKLLCSSAVIVLDMNGLVIDDEPVQLIATNAALEKYGISVSERTWKMCCLGRKAETFLYEILTSQGIHDVNLEEVIEDKETTYKNLLLRKIPSLVRKGVKDFIDYVSVQQNKHLVLATSSTRNNINTVIGHGLDILDKFDLIVSGNDVSKGKPDPEIYLYIRSAFAATERFLVFEDSPSGILAAVAAHMTCVAVPNKYTESLDLHEADFIISDLSRHATIISQKDQC